MSTGRSGSGLCPTQNRPAHIGWDVERPAADRRQTRVESDRDPVHNGRVGRSRSEFYPPDLRRIFAGNRQIFAGSRRIFSGSSPDLCDNHGIEAGKTTSSSDLNENFHLIAGSSPFFTGSSPNLLIFLRICVTTTGSKPKTPPQAQI